MGGEDMAKRHRKWMQLMEEAVQADGWGQVLEAVEAYEKAAGVILADLPTMGLTDDQHDIAEKVVVAMNLRAIGLSAVNGNPRPNKDDMAVLLEVLDSVTRKTPRVFPLDLADLDESTAAPSIARDSLPLQKEHQQSNRRSSKHDALPSTARVPDSTGLDDSPQTVTITIQKIGLKDVDRYVDPQIVVSVVDKDLVVVEEKQETSIAAVRSAPYIFFDMSVVLRTHLHVLRQSDSTIYFEFVHYKKAKRKKSVRCWAMLEMDEIKAAGSAALALELYTKPCDPSKKHLHLFTVKPLYLHIDIRLTAAN
ncbi:hypothetical protein H310_14437 [Aphanomyces invadans]|uniref:C2 Aida-type domain-containing protein n=1 Tax=Aphanomyces invadans TaxID=157072 RepID=A0A024TBY0_9STRA|nr:hypothetical protein H310_14437 [Aphanomyces invadans]ETV90842.1 hypothetical protein H310_14437 [Aphanomyces invadans]|eukprot:XP_008880520.1 hypothetical protein H310_14437 [Aphanomyces invadans]